MNEKGRKRESFFGNVTIFFSVTSMYFIRGHGMRVLSPKSNRNNAELFRLQFVNFTRFSCMIYIRKQKSLRKTAANAVLVDLIRHGIYSVLFPLMFTIHSSNTEAPTWNGSGYSQVSFIRRNDTT